MHHAYGYELTAEALAYQLCALTRLQRTQCGRSPCVGHGHGHGQDLDAALSVAEARRFVEHCCLIHGAAHGQPGRVLARFHPTVRACALSSSPAVTLALTVIRTPEPEPHAHAPPHVSSSHPNPNPSRTRTPHQVMVCALTYLKRLAAVTKTPPRKVAPPGAEVGVCGSAAEAAGGAVSAGAADMPGCDEDGEGVALLASLLAGDGWQVALLATLVLVTKTYSDFADCLVTNAVLCDHRSGLRAGWPLCTGARLRRAEHDLLYLLDFRTTVSATELFDVGRESVAQNLGKY